MKKDKFQFIELELKALGGKMILYRPVGTKELELIRESNYRIFPPRLADQPIFYPVLNEQYNKNLSESGKQRRIKIVLRILHYTIQQNRKRLCHKV